MDIEDKYLIITWPETQNYMELDGFYQNSCLINEEPFLSEYGLSAYFVKENWINKQINPYDN